MTILLPWLLQTKEGTGPNTPSDFHILLFLISVYASGAHTHPKYMSLISRMRYGFSFTSISWNDVLVVTATGISLILIYGISILMNLFYHDLPHLLRLIQKWAARTHGQKNQTVLATDFMDFWVRSIWKVLNSGTIFVEKTEA